MIRPAARADARALAELEVRAWRWAYVDIVGEEHMITVDDRERRWRLDPIDEADVAEVAGRVVGVVQSGPSPDEPSVGLLRGMYVEPAAQGAGVGTALYEHAMQRLHGAGRTEAVLWVFAANGHARGFYERRGWVPDGATAASHGAPELRYRQNQGG